MSLLCAIRLFILYNVIPVLREAAVVSLVHELENKCGLWNWNLKV
jgi:hypothetical protein